MKKSQFLPMSKEEMKLKKWDQLDIILVTGDAYIDHPSFGVALIGRFLESHGYKVGIIAQPDCDSLDDFTQLGEPKLFFGVTGGNVDSLIANYSANKRFRKADDYTPGGKAGKRPDRACIMYTNKLKQAFGSRVPIVLGGIGASLRRLAHYDYWANKVRRSLLLDAKADLLVYGMGEMQILNIANHFAQGDSVSSCDTIPGTVCITNDLTLVKNYTLLPSFDDMQKNKKVFNKAFRIMYENMNPSTAKILVQPQGNRFVLQNPPALPLSQQQMDTIYNLPFMRNPHPSYAKQGEIKAFKTIQFSINSHRGCCGECSFCSLFMHQGRIIQSRSEQSVLKEAKLLTQQKDFKGTITDVGGPTVNLYHASCDVWSQNSFCSGRHCLTPKKCQNLKLGYNKAINLYTKIRNLPKVKHVFLGSGIRYDLLTDPSARRYLEAICK